MAWNGKKKDRKGKGRERKRREGRERKGKGSFIKCTFLASVGSPNCFIFLPIVDTVRFFSSCCFFKITLLLCGLYK